MFGVKIQRLQGAKYVDDEKLQPNQPLIDFIYIILIQPEEPLPTCEAGFIGQLPHPNNCNWFIHCPGNGGGWVQQCQHLFHFDILTDRCVFNSLAVCIRD